MWVRVGDETDIEPGEALRVEVDPPIAVFNVDGEFFATEDTCTHEESSLADGYIDGDVVECSFHFAKFSILTGKVLSLPATQSLRTFPVKVEAGCVYVDTE
jgi:3-phenylpropionate/trans-cinnamate dioxygenase ferredoxin component